MKIVDPRAAEQAAFAAERRKDYPEAIELWLRLIEEYGNWEHGYACYYLSNCYVHIGRFDEAEYWLVEAVKIEPKDEMFSDALESLRDAKKSGIIK
jgi:tetratricopeptide (TPR) repeat protein